jgi:hypothetical protein
VSAAGSPKRLKFGGGPSILQSFPFEIEQKAAKEAKNQGGSFPLLPLLSSVPD